MSLYKKDFVDVAYKTGSGRYIQHSGALTSIPEELQRLRCSRALVVTGENSRIAAGDEVKEILKSAGLLVSFEVYSGTPCEDCFKYFANMCREKNCDVVVGVGGGRIMDIAKAIATIAEIKVIEVPTSIATCAAFSTLTVVYTPDGAFDGAWRLEKEVDAIVVDMTVIAKAPARLLAAGSLDSMAKMLEIAHFKGELTLDNDSFDRYCAFSLAKTNYEILLRETVKAYKDCQDGLVSDELEHVAFTNICLTGIVTALTRNLRQVGLGHKFYDGLKSIFGDDVSGYLHGELVAIGLRMQALFNNQPEHEKELITMMCAMSMPCTLADIGISSDDDRVLLVRDYVKNSGFVDVELEDKLFDVFKVTVR